MKLQAGGRWRLRLQLAVLLACSVSILAGCSAPAAPQRLELAGEAMGTGWSIVLVVQQPYSADRVAELRQRVASVLDRVDRGMSTWRDDADLFRFNHQPTLLTFAFSAETRRVLSAALELARETGGAFDPTVGPLVRLWGFGAEAASREPSAGELSGALKRVGFERLSWSEDGRRLRREAGVELDLSAIAKGYAVDALVREVAQERPVGLLVELGGEVRALGSRANGDPWRVGIDAPGAPGSQLATSVSLSGGALATSGDYRQTRGGDGKRRSHVIDPRTGRPVDTRVASASVLAPTCMEADAVATALMVLGPEDGLAWVEKRPWLEALLALRQGDRIVEWRASSGWPQASVPAL